MREQGRRVDCRAFTVWWKCREAPVANPGARVCVVASGAAVGNAVNRTRAKRRLREIFRQHQHLVPTSCDLLLVARAGVVQQPLAELEKKFTEACSQIAPAVSSEQP